MTALRVVIADDQPMMRAGFKAVLEATGDIEVVGEAGNGEEAVEVATEQAPDVVLMDIRMPGMDGIEATRRTSRRSPAWTIWMACSRARAPPACASSSRSKAPRARSRRASTSPRTGSCRRR